MSGAIVNITLPGEPRKNNDRWLRGVCEDTRVDSIRKLVTQMMSKPADFQIGSKRGTPTWRTKAYKPDTEVLPGVEVDAKVEAELDRA